MVASKISSFSERIQERPVSENKKSTFTESKSLEKECHEKENYDDVMCKTPMFSLLSLIKIRATDREGNTIEVTY
jgi:hypothetical protein